MFKDAELFAPPKSFGELLSFSQAMAKNEKTGFLTLNFDWLYWPLMKMNGIELLTPDFKKPAFNTPAAVHTLNRLAKATASGAINKISWTGRWVEPNSAFSSGTVGMMHAHSAAYFFVKGQGGWINPETLGATQAPGDWSTPTNHGFAISKSSKNSDLAFALIKHMTSAKWATRFAQMRRVLTANIEADKAGLASCGRPSRLCGAANSARAYRQALRQLAAGERCAGERRILVGIPERRSRPEGCQDCPCRRRTRRHTSSAQVIVEAIAMSVGAMETAIKRPRFAKRRSTRKAVLIWSFLAPSLLILLLYRILPLLWNVLLSFEAWSPLKPAVFTGLDNYQEMFFDDDVFWQALWNTLGIIASAPVGIAIAVGLALLVNSNIRGRDIYRTLIFLSYPLMTVAVAIIWRWMFDERVGLINYAARSLHLTDQPILFLNSFTWVLPCVIVANIWQMLGFYMIIILTGRQTIPGNLYEAAKIDGANAFRRFLRISLPLLRPSLFLCFVIGMLNSVTSFDLVYVMTAGGPGHATEILVTYIYKLAFNQTRFDYAAAITVVFFLLLLAVTWTANRLSGGNAGAVEHD
jgi:ABC-type sugar transport system permease subunit